MVTCRGRQIRDSHMEITHPDGPCPLCEAITSLEQIQAMANSDWVSPKEINKIVVCIKERMKRSEGPQDKPAWPEGWLPTEAEQKNVKVRDRKKR